MKIIITAGPTREMLDPVRFLSNLSTGHMGYELARAAQKKGHDVTLISGPTNLKPPRGVHFIAVISARDMKAACDKFFPASEVLIMTAAVCDFTAARRHAQKIHRTQTRQFLLKQTPDIVASLGKKKGKRIVVGFCLETQDWIGQAKDKLKRKSLDGIVANYYGASHVPFGDRTITTAFIDHEGKVQMLRKVSKPRIARKLLEWVSELKSSRILKKKSF